MGMSIDNLCNSCTNIGCEFQSGIVRTECAFYMPPYLEPDNCGNYVVMQQTYEAKLKADMVTMLDKIRAEIKHHSEHFINDDGDDCLAVYEDDVFEIIDKYKAESEVNNG